MDNEAALHAQIVDMFVAQHDQADPPELADNVVSVVKYGSFSKQVTGISKLVTGLDAIKKAKGSGPGIQGSYYPAEQKLSPGFTAVNSSSSAKDLHVNYTLLPGEKAYASPAGNVVHVSAGGKLTLLKYDSKGGFAGSNGISTSVIAEYEAGHLPLLKANDAPLKKSNLVFFTTKGGTKIALGPDDALYSLGGAFIFTIQGKPAATISSKGLYIAVNPGTYAFQSYSEWIKENQDAKVAEGKAEADESDSVKSPLVDGHFVHPVSGAKVKLIPGDVLYNHKISTKSWLVIHPLDANHKDGAGTFVDKNGKVSKASPIALKAVLSGNYSEVYVVPKPAEQVKAEQKQLMSNLASAKSVVPGSVSMGPDVELKLQPGQKAYKSSSAKYVLLFNQGDLLQLFVHATGKELSHSSSDAVMWKEWAKDHPEFLIAEYQEPTQVEQPIGELAPWGPINTLDDAAFVKAEAYKRLYTVHDWASLSALRDLIQRDILTLAQTAKVIEISKVDKTYFTKARTRLSHIVRLIDVREKVEAGDISEAVSQEIAALAKYMSAENVGKAFGSSFPMFVNSYYQAVEAAHSKNVFKASLGSVGFDIYSGSLAQYQGFAKAQGFPWPGGLNKESGALWAQAKLGDPAIGNPEDVLSSIEKLAKLNVSLANAKIAALSVLKIPPAEKKAEAPKAAQEASSALAEKLEAEAGELYAVYTGNVQGSILGFGLSHIKNTKSWKLDHPHTGISELTDAQAVSVIKHNNAKPTTTVLAYPDKSAVQKYKNKLHDLIGEASDGNASLLNELTPSQLNKVIKAHGGNYVGKMNADVKRSWLRWYALGFPTATYALEHKAVENSSNTSVHVAAKTNPGSWQSFGGAALWQSLSNQIASIPNGEVVLECIRSGPGSFAYMSVKVEERTAVLAAVGLLPLVPVLSTINSASVVYGEFARLHWKHLPEASVKKAQPAPSVVETYEKIDGGTAHTASPGQVPPTPAGIEPEDWALVVALAQGSKDPDLKKAFDLLVSDLPSDALPGSLPNFDHSKTVHAAKLLSSTEELKKLYYWATKHSAPYVYGQSLPIEEVNKKKQSLKKAIQIALIEDVAVKSNSKIWTHQSGHSFNVPPGGIVLQKKSDPAYYASLVLSPDLMQGFKTGNEGMISFMNKSSVQEYLNKYEDLGYHKVFEVPNPLTFEWAKKDIGAIKADWDMVIQAEKLEFEEVGLGNSELNEADVAIELAKSLSHSETYKLIHDSIANIPPSVQKVVLFAIDEGDTGLLDLIQWKLAKGHYDAVVEQSPLSIPLDSAAGKILAKGYVSPDQILANVTTSQMLAAIEQLAGPEGKKNVFTVNQAAEKVLKLLQGLSVGEPEKVTSGQELVLKKTSKSLGGMHSKIVWADPSGNEWMSKSFPNDHNSKVRVDSEHYANVIGRLHGFRAPETRIMTLDGSYSYVQLLKPAKSDLTALDPSDLTFEQLVDAMSEHILDWVVSNHDSNPTNLMIDQQGQIFGIDKGQAFRFFPEDKLEWGYLPHTNPIAVWYDKYYSRLAAGKVKKADADALVLAVLGRASYVQQRNNKRHEELLNSALANRKSWPDEYPNRQKFVSALMERKANLVQDFITLYAGLYKKAGWKWDFDLSQLGKDKIDDHTYVAVSDGLVADVKTMGSHGKALFFDTQDLEDAHVLVYVEKDVNGKYLLRGEMKLRKDADALVTAWLQEQLVEDSSGSGTTSIVQTPQNDASGLPGNNVMWAAVLTYAKTVNTHAADGKYNSETVANAMKVSKQIKALLFSIATWDQNHPEKVYIGSMNGWGSFVTAEQQEAWVAAANYYVTAIDQISKAQAENKKVKDLFPEAVPFVPQSYSPTPGLDMSGSPKVVSKWKVSDPEALLEVWSDGNWVLTSGKIKTKLTTAKGLALKNSDAEAVPPEAAPEPTPAEPEADAEATITSTTGKVLKVFKRKNSGTLGQYDGATGVLKHHKGELHEPYKGYEYDIEHGNVLVEYRPWNEADVAKSQQGLLRFTVKEWNGSKDQLEDVLDTIQSIGVDLSPADEQSLELHYWRHLYGILQSRSIDSGKHSDTLKAIRNGFKSNPNMDSLTELEMLKDAWAKSFGKKVVDEADFMPKFDRTLLKMAPEGMTGGKPYWIRPDYDLTKLRKKYGDNLPVHHINNFNQRIRTIIESGGLYSTEERTRLLGAWITGMSSSEDQFKGSANFLFTRQSPESYSYDAYPFYLHPSVFLRTSNYAFSSDHYGNPDHRKDHSPFDLDAVASIAGGSNEMMIKNGVSVLDGIGVIIFTSAKLRDEAVDILKKAGITEIHGLPITEVFVTGYTEAKKTSKKIWDKAIAAEKGK